MAGSMWLHRLQQLIRDDENKAVHVKSDLTFRNFSHISVTQISVSDCVEIVTTRAGGGVREEFSFTRGAGACAALTSVL